MISTLALLCLLNDSLKPQAHIALRGARAVQTVVPRYGKYELTLDLVTSAANPFDPDQIDVEATFLSPAGKTVVVPGFYYQEFTRRLEGGEEKVTPAAEPVWKVRFAPNVEGRWLCRVTAKDATGRAALAPIRFRVTPSTSRGFVRRGAVNPAGFTFDDGKAFCPVGENMCWGGKAGTFDYDRWLPDLHRAGGDWIRIWMSDNSLGIEWSGPKPTGGDFTGYHGAGCYSQSQAWKLDRVLDVADQNDVYAMLCLGTYGEFNIGGYFNEGRWPFNPYNIANGGPCKTPDAFWTDPTARKLYRRRLRYLAARYGWRTNLFGWEFWNEKEAPAAWVGEMARCLKGAGEFAEEPRDPYRHLVSTTYGNAEVWKLPEIDFTMSHHYGEGNVVDHAPVIHNDIRENAVYGKPHLMAEFGIDWRKSDSDYDPKGLGVNLHNGMWSSLASGGAGSAMLWWWDNYVDPKFFNPPPNNAYPPFLAARRFADAVDWQKGVWKPVHAEPARIVDGQETFTDLVLRPQGAWGKAAVADLMVPPRGSVADGVVPTFLYGPAKADLRTTPAFQIDYPKAGRFILRINQVSQAAVLRIDLDGRTVRELRFNAAPVAGKPEYAKTEFEKEYNIYKATYGRDYAIDVPAGQHVITLEATEGDWISLDRITFTGCRSNRYPDVFVCGITDGRSAVLWAQNAQHNWKNAYEHHPVPPIPASLLAVDGLSDGRYRVDWWDTEKGVVVRRETARVLGGRASLRLPAITTDVAALLVVDGVR